jgi:hypothetical protein
MTIAAQYAANCFEVGAVLKSKGDRDRRVPRIHVCRGTGLVIGEENLADSAVSGERDLL